MSPSLKAVQQPAKTTVCRRIIMRDWSLYLVTDRAMLAGREYIQTVLQAVSGGVTAVQLREKELPTRELVTLAKALVQALRPLKVPLIINDRLDVALAADADGVHLGQEDMDATTARHLIGRDRLLGISASTPAEAQAAERAGADYIGGGVVFDTATKADYTGTIGILGLSSIVHAVHIPVVAIGGIGPATIPELRAIPGLAGLAVVSAILKAQDPREAASRLLDLWRPA